MTATLHSLPAPWPLSELTDAEVMARADQVAAELQALSRELAARVAARQVAERHLTLVPTAASEAAVTRVSRVGESS